MVISQVLLCNPLHFSVEYQINPWMKPGSVDLLRAQQQWAELKKTLESLDVEVAVIDQQPGLPDMVFAADQALIKDHKLVLSNFHYDVRKKETQAYLPFFRSLNYEMLTLPPEVYFEGGGDCVWLGETLLIGSGFRNSPAVATHLGEFFQVQVQILELIDPRFYHLDTCLLVLDSQTAFYYPPAFSPASQALLTQLIPHLHTFSKAEVTGFAANSVVSDGTVLVQTGNPTFIEKIQNLGFSPLELDVSEFMKAGGGLHCLISLLAYQP